MSFMFENLDVYQKSISLADRIYGLTEGFPRGSYYLSDQLNRAALSVPANLAEGNGRWHKADRKQFFWIARGSAHECVPILELAKRRGLVEDSTVVALKGELEVLCKMISGLINGIPDVKKKDGAV